MRKLICLFLVAILAGSTTCSYAENEKLRKQFIYDFVKVLSFRHLEYSRDNDTVGFNNLPDATIRIMKDFQLANDDLNHGMDIMEKYLTSEDKQLQAATNVIVSFLKARIKIHNNALDLLESLYSPDNTKHLGEIMREISLNAAQAEIFEGSFLIATTLISTLMISEEKNENGERLYSNYLIFNKKEQEALSEKLIRIYGPDIKTGWDSGLSYEKAPGAVLYQTLNLQGFEPIN